jgi:pimeloyl-ACP methyl ester carboxylesterase
MHNIFIQLAEKQLAGLCSFKNSNNSASVPIEKKNGVEKPTLLMLHGWQDNAASFDVLFADLVKHYHVVALDWPGHGLSDHRDGDNFYHFVDYIDDLHQVIEFLSVQNLYLVGHSLGAIVAGCYAAAFPEKVQGIVLIEGLTPLYETADNTVLRLKQGITSRQRYRQRNVIRPKRKMASFEEALNLRCVVNKLSKSDLYPLVERGTETDGEHWYWLHDERLRCDSLYRMAGEHAHALMSQIQCPVLSIVGHDGFQQLQRKKPERVWFQQFKQVKVAGGHHCHIDSPNDVYRHILTFTQRF